MHYGLLLMNFLRRNNACISEELIVCPCNEMQLEKLENKTNKYRNK